MYDIYFQKTNRYIYQYKKRTGFPGSSDGKESACKAGHRRSIPELERFPREGNGNPLQYSCLENFSGQRSLVGYNPWDGKQLDTSEWLTHSHT